MGASPLHGGDGWMSRRSNRKRWSRRDFMGAATWELNLKTDQEQFSPEEQNKLAQGSIAGSLSGDFDDQSYQELHWESGQLAKSHGIYLEFNRDVKGKEKDWVYMLRMTIPGGGPLTKDQWSILNEI